MEKKSRGDWRELVAQWRASGLSGREFAKTIGVSDATVHYWAKRVGREKERQTMTLARVEKTEDSSPIAIELPGGAVVRIDRAFDEELLRRVVTALGRS